MATVSACIKDGLGSYVGRYETPEGFSCCNMRGWGPKPGNSSDDNRIMSVFTSKLTPAADICVGLTILSVGMYTQLLRFCTALFWNLFKMLFKIIIIIVVAIIIINMIVAVFVHFNWNTRNEQINDLPVHQLTELNEKELFYLTLSNKYLLIRCLPALISPQQ